MDANEQPDSIVSDASCVERRLDLIALRKEELVDLVIAHEAQIASLIGVVEKLTKRIEELEKQAGKGGPPPFVRANKPQRQKQDRKRRDLHFSRKREKPTVVVPHVPLDCPDCGRKLEGGWVAYRRQIIDIKPAPVEITEHEVYGRHCGVCARDIVPKVDLSANVLGAHRVGVGLMSLIAYLKEVGRMTIRNIQHFLKAQHQVHLSVGEIVKVLHAVAKKGEDAYQSLLKKVRLSSFVHVDETGWREDGQNGYLWVAATPAIRAFVYKKSRAGVVAEELLGEDFDKILVSDFYCGYNRFACLKQRCWVHLLRDLHKLRESVPQDQAVGTWIDAVTNVYERARSYQDECREGKSFGCGVFDRQKMRRRFEAELQALSEPYTDKHRLAPQRVLATRMLNYLPELFTFVEFPEVPSENNAAERAIRPAVIARKVCGGTRSEQGSKTKTVLMSLFQTWRAQGVDPIAQCQKMLAGHSP